MNLEKVNLLKEEMKYVDEKFNDLKYRIDGTLLENYEKKNYF